MKKMAILSASMGALFLVGISVVALSGINQLSNLQVKADPIEYSVTFSESNTTAGGNKVGVVGCYSGENFTFNGVSFRELHLFNYDGLKDDAFEFSIITGFAISFSGKGEEPLNDMHFISENGNISHVESGKEYKGLSITPSNAPTFRAMMGSFTITSLTIFYSC